MRNGNVARNGHRLFRRPFPSNAWHRRAKAYLLFAGTFFLVILLPLLAQNTAELFDPPFKGWFEATYATPRPEAGYQLSATTQRGRIARASCARTKPDNATYKCVFSGDGDALGALIAAQWRDPRLAKTGSGESMPDMRLTTITPPIWLLWLQLLILALWLRASTGPWRWPEIERRWLPWIILPIAVHVVGAQVLQRFTDADTGAAFMGLVRDQWRLQPMTTLLGIGVLAPGVEELFFRGLGWDILRRGFNDTWTSILTTLPFAAIHGAQYGIQALALLLVTGYLLGMLRSALGSVVPCAIAHMLINSTALALLAWS